MSNALRDLGVISKVAKELDNNLGLGDRALAEFLVHVGKTATDSDKFISTLHENEADFPEAFSRNLHTVVQHMVGGTPIQTNAKESNVQSTHSQNSAGSSSSSSSSSSSIASQSDADHHHDSSSRQSHKSSRDPERRSRSRERKHNKEDQDRHHRHRKRHHNDESDGSDGGEMGYQSHRGHR